MNYEAVYTICEIFFTRSCSINVAVASQTNQLLLEHYQGEGEGLVGW